MAAKKRVSPKSKKPVDPKKRAGGKRATGKGNGPGGARSTDLQKLLAKTQNEVEHFFAKLHDDETFIDYECSTLEMAFGLEYLDNGFKISPAYQKVFTEDNFTEDYACKQGKKLLLLKRVQRFLAAQLHYKRLAAGVTQQWVAKKYKEWSEIDPTEFFEIEETHKLVKGKWIPSGRYRILLKCALSELPRHVRTAIKSMSVDSRTGSIKVELVDQKGALDQLSKLMGFANESLINLDTDEVHLHFDQQDENA